MSLPVPGQAELPNRSPSGLARHFRAIGLRSRLMLLTVVSAVPALGVLAYYQWGLNMLTGMVAPEWQSTITVTGGLLLLGGALMSVGFGIVVGEQALRRPTAALMDAAEKWTAGDISARIEVDAVAGTEFGRIGTAFNRLADSLGRRHDELRALNAELEARVAERTQALSAANARLVAEMAERERAEATLRQTQKLQAVGQLAGRFAHDFNNVLTSIVASLDVLRGRTPSSQEASLRLIDNALNAGERGRKLTGQLLSFSGRQRLTPMPTDLNDTVTALVDLLANTVGAGIRIETDFTPDLWLAKVDPSQAEAAILNLAVNARDAMPEGGRLRLTTRNVALDKHEKLRAGNYIAVEVTDTGIGMTDEVVRTAFEPFFTTKTATKASGLGLSQVHGLASQSGGDVSIRSVPGLGTTVTLLLPRATEDVASPLVPAPSPGGHRPAEPAPDGKCRTRLQVIRGGISDTA